MNISEYQGDCPDLCRGFVTLQHSGRFAAYAQMPAEGTAAQPEQPMETKI